MLERFQAYKFAVFVIHIGKPEILLLKIRQNLPLVVRKHVKMQSARSFGVHIVVIHAAHSAAEIVRVFTHLPRMSVYISEVYGIPTGFFDVFCL
jgi:hypothetical protein